MSSSQRTADSGGMRMNEISRAEQWNREPDEPQRAKDAKDDSGLESVEADEPVSLGQQERHQTVIQPSP